MRKFLKVVLIVLLVIGLVMLISLINHRLKLKQEAELFETNGTLVEVNGHRLNVYVGGEPSSDVTLVFMSGAGTCSPTLDFKTLYTLFEPDYQVAVVEKAGYGFSDVSDVNRDIDTILYETRTALELAGAADKPYILFPHSMSGIEALYWANLYPEEIKGIVGLDPSVPASYENIKMNLPLFHIARFAADIGLTRFFPAIVDASSAIQDGNLTEQEKEVYRAVFYRRTSTLPMLNEIKSIENNALELAAIDDSDVPLLFFVSNGDVTGFDESEWQGFLINYVSGKPNGEYVKLDCSHYVLNLEAERIHSESVRFIEGLGVGEGR